MRKYVIITAISCSCLFVSICLLITCVYLYAVPHSLTSEFAPAQCVIVGVTCWGDNWEQTNATWDMDLNKDCLYKNLTKAQAMKVNVNDMLKDKAIYELNEKYKEDTNMTMNNINTAQQHLIATDSTTTENNTSRQHFEDSDLFTIKESNTICALCQSGKPPTLACDKSVCGRHYKQPCLVPLVRVMDNGGHTGSLPDASTYRKLIADPWMFYSITASGAPFTQVNMVLENHFVLRKNTGLCFGIECFDVIRENRFVLR